MNFEPTIIYIGPTGTQVIGDRGTAVSLGRIVLADVRGVAPKPSEVARELVRELQGRRSFWPSTGTTRNRGPYATGLSVGSFRAVQGRSVTGQFGRYAVINDARNRRGDAYAGYVNEGIRSGGLPVSPARYAANYNAVARTWDMFVRRGGLGEVG